MLINDPISDMLIRIKNALMSSKETVVIPHSKLKEAVAHKLEENNYVQAVEVNELKPQSELKITLRYVDELPAITGMKRISKPGRRLYAKASSIPVTLNGYGITVISTNKGVLTDSEAREANVGGELICKVW
jgi:small subunit ribosomal protein S8